MQRTITEYLLCISTEHNAKIQQSNCTKGMTSVAVTIFQTGLTYGAISEDVGGTDDGCSGLCFWKERNDTHLLLISISTKNLLNKT